MKHFDVIKTSYVFAILSAIFLVVCMAWGVVLTDPALKELHFNILRILYPGLSMSFGGFIIGLVEAVIYGSAFGATIAWLCNKLCVTK